MEVDSSDLLVCERVGECIDLPRFPSQTDYSTSSLGWFPEDPFETKGTHSISVPPMERIGEEEGS